MGKSRKKMSPEEIREMEYFQGIRLEKNPDVRFSKMMKHSKGQCEHADKRRGWRCPNMHLQHGETMKGKVVLTPYRDKLLYCQRCQLDAISERLERPLAGVGTVSRKKPIHNQLEMFS